MSYTREQLEEVETLWSDFDTALSQREWDECLAILDNTGELGYENEALRMHKTYNRVSKQVIDGHQLDNKEEIDAEIEGTEMRLRGE